MNWNNIALLSSIEVDNWLEGWKWFYVYQIINFSNISLFYEIFEFKQ